MTTQTKKFTSVKGMPDIMPPDSAVWQRVEAAAREVFCFYGYHEIRTPVVEHTALFKRGVGEGTSIVEKEMYQFTDQGGDDLALRPEGTASVVRAYIESGAHIAQPLARYYYMGPMFRRERPQKGRQRQFYQIGCELLGADSPLADAEVIAMIDHFLARAGAGDITPELNSIGCPNCRPPFNEALLAFLKSRGSGLCADCAKRLERNPMRTLDCKIEGCREKSLSAPRISEFWCPECNAHFGSVRRNLDSIKVPYKVNERIVRGLDYYMRTAFEFKSAKLGSQDALVGGGRYDGLVRSLGGPDIPGIGFALGMERLMLVVNDSASGNKREDMIFFAVMGDAAKEKALPLIQTLRRDGVRVEWDYASRSLKAQMRLASKSDAESVVIIGDDEAAKDSAMVRDMRAGTQHEVKIKDLPMHFVHID